MVTISHFVDESSKNGDGKDEDGFHLHAWGFDIPQACYGFTC